MTVPPEAHETSERTPEPAPPQGATNPDAPREPDSLDLLANAMLTVQQLHAAIGGAIYSALVHVRQLQQQRGDAPTAGTRASAALAGPAHMTRAQVRGDGGTTGAAGASEGPQVVQLVDRAPSSARFNQRPRGTTPEHMAAVAASTAIPDATRVVTVSESNAPTQQPAQQPAQQAEAAAPAAPPSPSEATP